MFDEILKLVQSHIGGNSQASAAIPAEQADDVHNEIASHINNGLQAQATAPGGAGGLLSMLEGGMSSGSPVVSAIEGGLVNSLATKFGLPPSVTGAIAGALPGILQKFATKANDPNDPSITPQSIGNSLPGGIGGALGGLFK